MTALRVAIGAIWLIAFQVGRDMSEPIVPPALPATSTGITAQYAGLPGGVIQGPLMEDQGPDTRTDLFGNEVEEAVADYRIDLRGDVYERHSPETAVPRSGSPST